MTAASSSWAATSAARMSERRTAEATALAESVVVCDEAVLRSLPKAAETSALSGGWSASESAVTGTIDACRLGSERILSLSRLAEIAAAEKLADVDGAFQLAVHDGGRLLLARDAIGHRTLFYA